MTDQKFKELKEKYPNILGKLDGAACDNGWEFLIEEACRQIDWHNLYTQNKYAVLQIKEKFGVLRIYYGVDGKTCNDPYVNGVLQTIEGLSGKICESCGTTKDIGKTVKGWIKTVCCDCSLTQNRANDWHSLEYLEEQIKNKTDLGRMMEQIMV